MSNSLDSDQTRCCVGSNICPICLQRLKTDVGSRQRVKHKPQIATMYLRPLGKSA